MPADEGSTPKVNRRLAAILAADIAGYRTLIGTDEEATLRDLKAHPVVVLPMVGEYSGAIIYTGADGFLAEFSSVLNAMNCALAIQQVMTKRNTSVDPGVCNSGLG